MPIRQSGRAFGEIVGEAERERVALADGLSVIESDGVIEGGVEWESDGEKEDDADIVTDGVVVRVNDDEFDGRDVEVGTADEGYITLNIISSKSTNI